MTNILSTFFKYKNFIDVLSKYFTNRYPDRLYNWHKNCIHVIHPTVTKIYPRYRDTPQVYINHVIQIWQKYRDTLQILSIHVFQMSHTLFTLSRYDNKYFPRFSIMTIICIHVIQLWAILYIYIIKLWTKFNPRFP